MRVQGASRQPQSKAPEEQGKAICMRNLARAGILAVALVGTVVLSGCCDPVRDASALGMAEPIAPPQASSVRSRKAARPVVKRVVEARVVPAGSKIRSFCGQRHIRFQSGALKESDSEKARNDVLCRQVY